MRSVFIIQGRYVKIICIYHYLIDSAFPLHNISLNFKSNINTPYVPGTKLLNNIQISLISHFYRWWMWLIILVKIVRVPIPFFWETSFESWKTRHNGMCDWLFSHKILYSTCIGIETFFIKKPTQFHCSRIIL